MNKERLTKFRHKKDASKRWKQGQVIQEEYADTVQVCRDGIRKAKAPWRQIW